MSELTMVLLCVYALQKSAVHLGTIGTEKVVRAKEEGSWLTDRRDGSRYETTHCAAIWTMLAIQHAAHFIIRFDSGLRD